MAGWSTGLHFSQESRETKSPIPSRCHRRHIPNLGLQVERRRARPFPSPCLFSLSPSKSLSTHHQHHRPPGTNTQNCDIVILCVYVWVVVFVIDPSRLSSRYYCVAVQLATWRRRCHRSRYLSGPGQLLITIAARAPSSFLLLNLAFAFAHRSMHAERAAWPGENVAS